jgi:peptidoglycan/LPS O-acetylase OafA/YrhL
MTTAEIIRPSDANSIKGIAPHFYRPELDALRFLAFLAVYVCHSIPNAWVADASRTGTRTSIQALAAVKDAGNFGVCLFFLLSAFLITELLRREYEVYGSIHASAFYLRRILRIWPLYFGITIAYVIGGHFFPALRLEPGRVVAYFLLAGNWYIALHPWIQTPLRALWSISVEEQFYLAWPLVAKFRGMGGLIAASLTIVPMSLLTIYITSANEPYAYTRVWLNSLTQFQFFAWGAMLALALNGLRLKLNSVLRAAMALVGSSFWLLAAAVAQIKRPGVRITPPQACFGYVLIAAGCIFLFLAVFGVSTHRVPRWVVYLGKISFGLYVFHETAFLFMDEAQKHAENLLPVFGAWASQHLVLILTINKIAALFVTIVLAAISYRFWESPFLRLRRRFTFIESRGV